MRPERHDRERVLEPFAHRDGSVRGRAIRGCALPGRALQALRTMIALGCVTGRFQPVHPQHLELFEMALGGCRHLIVAITNPDVRARHRDPASTHRHTAHANPFTYFERLRLLESCVRDRGWAERITIVPFHLSEPKLWSQYVPLAARQFVRAYGDWERQKVRMFEQAGYAVSVLQGDPAQRLSAGDIRLRMRDGDNDWQHLVPASTVALLTEFIAEAPLDERG